MLAFGFFQHSSPVAPPLLMSKFLRLMSQVSSQILVVSNQRQSTVSSTSPTNIFWLLHFWSWGKPQTSKDLETDTAIIKARKCTTTTAVILLLKLFKDYLLSSMYFFRQSKVEQITLVMISTEHLHSTERQMTPQQIFSCENQNRTSVSKALQIRRVRHSPHS